ncbi:UBAP1-MVB12-associated (UMA)-domain containing protein 1 [Labeo rohita]|uniref:UBAP1-MVB12-associated (UMA)-domain containing protein 1 n=1 Tax=Labeo rohita TaxID=84645 RepID=A0ABQ8LQF5_LABRO|nr:UBAP1-MVB12-associated (UMA)-domain containing protein 1 [Labeo rohita]
MTPHPPQTKPDFSSLRLQALLFFGGPVSQFSLRILFLFVQPSSAGNRGITETAQPSSQPTTAKTSSETHAVDATPALPELLGDIPFTLAPHILAMQAGLPFVTDITLPHDINDKLANFRYDFTLENSVLCEP